MPTVKYYPFVCRLISAIAVALPVVLSIQGLSEVALGQTAPAPPAVATPAPPAVATPATPAAVGGNTAAPAGPYWKDPNYDKTCGEPAKKREVTKVLNNGFAGDRKVFDDYYDKFALARWTNDEPHELANFRKELSTDLRMAAVRDANVHQELGSKILAYMGKLVQGNVHPAVRVNAMLMIGELNATEDKKTPTPLPAALTDYLLPAVSDARQPDAVRVAAMIGIVRHAKLGIATAADRDAVREKMRAFAAAKTPPDSAADGRAWMRALAAEALGAIGQTGSAGDVVKALAAMVDDSGLSLSTRCIAAEALGKLDYSDPRGLDASVVAAPLGRLAVDVSGAEAKQLSRRRVKARLNAISLAVAGDPADPKHAGVATLPAGSDPQLMAGVKKSLQALTALTDDEKLDDLGLSEGIKREAAALAAQLPKTAP